MRSRPPRRTLARDARVEQVRIVARRQGPVPVRRSARASSRGTAGRTSCSTRPAWSRSMASRPRRSPICSRSSATPPTASPGCRLGQELGRRRCSRRGSHIDAIPDDPAAGTSPVRGADRLAASLREHRAEARAVPHARDAAPRLPDRVRPRRARVARPRSRGARGAVRGARAARRRATALISAGSRRPRAPTPAAGASRAPSRRTPASPRLP